MLDLLSLEPTQVLVCIFYEFIYISENSSKDHSQRKHKDIILSLSTIYTPCNYWKSWLTRDIIAFLKYQKSFCKNCNCSRVGFQDIDLGSKERNFGELRIKIFLTEWCKQKYLLHGRTQSSNIRLTIIWQLRGKGTLR